MNILFFTAFKPSRNKGGTERASITLASCFKKFYNWNSYGAYIEEDGEPKEECFIEVFQVSGKHCIKELENLINKKQIDCFIDQTDLHIAANINRAAIPEKTKVILAYHFEPGWDVHFFTKKTLRENLKDSDIGKKVKSLIKLMFFDVYFGPRYLKRLDEDYYKSFKNVDKTVLLSKGFIKAYAEYAKVDEKDYHKFEVIPNSLTYDDEYDPKRVTLKEKRVLIVSRLEENQKRISRALEIWRRIKRHDESKQWKLDIVGNGPDAERYKQIVKQKEIPDIEFYGRKDPRSFYERSSIFMMTSESEGWPLTISESLQFGVVPIVYDTVASLSELIIDGKNGVLIENENIDEYCKKIISLMKDEELRIEMANNAIESSKRFEKLAIVEKWKELIDNI